MLDLLATTPWLVYLLAILLGLMVGSFLNVVIYRLPLMLRRDWHQECCEFLGLEKSSLPSDMVEDGFNLAVPRSACPQCQQPISAWHNIPVLSYVCLGGKCHHCKHAIAMRYPIVEALTGLLSLFAAIHFGFSGQLAGALLLIWGLIALSFIDIDHQLLPDNLTYPLLWLGLLFNLQHTFTDISTAVIGAIAGYMSLWLVMQAYRLMTGKAGMGYGDFKLLAVLGAWLGWQYLPLIMLLSALCGVVLGGLHLLLSRQSRHTPIPFGPYLATAGIIALLYGPSLLQSYGHYY